MLPGLCTLSEPGFFAPVRSVTDFPTLLRLPKVRVVVPEVCTAVCKPVYSENYLLF